jgi:Tfp pilus assembly PilM family ATPase/Tfp pilus assembly protein PilN
MKSWAKTALGIDIGLSRVSLALVAREGDGYRLVRSVSQSLSDDAARSYPEVAVEALARTLRKLKRHCRIPRMKAAMGVSVSPLVLQMLDLPKQVPPNMHEFVENELGQYVTLSGKTIVSDFYVVGSVRGLQKRLLSTACEKETIQKLVAICDEAGLTIQTVEPSILAYARARYTQGKWGVHAARVLVVEINAGQLSACLLRKGALDFVRTKSIPPEAQTPQAADEWLADEVQAMIRHYNLETSGDDETWEVNIIVKDGAATTLDSVESVKARTGMLPQIIMEANGSEGAGPDTHSSPVAAAGLAMKLLEGQADPWKINLLPREVTQARLFARHVLVTAIAVATLFLGMTLSLLAITHTAAGLRADLDRKRATQEAPTTVALVGEIQSIDQQTAWAERQLQEIKKVLDAQTPVNWAGILNTVGDNTPAGVCITRVWSLDAQRLTVRGMARSCGAVQSFVQSLAKAGVFESVSLGRLERWQGSDSLVEYEMDCMMKPTPQEGLCW